MKNILQGFFSNVIECETKAATILEFSFNQKLFSWMHALRTQSVRSSLVPRPVCAIRVTRGCLELSAVLGKFSRQA